MERKIILDANVFTRIAKEINPTAATVYATIIGHRNGRTGECYITQETLANELGMSDRTVRRNLNELKTNGFLDWKQGSSFSSKANSYIFPLESFDLDGKGAKIEEKKLKSKNKEEQIKERVKAKIEAEEVKEEVPAAVKEARIEKKKEKAAERKVSNDVNSLIKECVKISEEYNELAKANLELFKHGFSQMQFNLEADVKKLVKEEKIEAAMSILTHDRDQKKELLQALKNNIKFEKLSNEITIEEAVKVFNLVRHELSDSMANFIETKIIPRGNARSIVGNCKTILENKGMTFDLQALLAA